MRVAGPPLALLALLPCATPPGAWAAPAATIWANRTDFKGGDRLVLSARVVRDGSQTADVYLSLTLPGGARFYFDRFPLQLGAVPPDTPVPILRGWPVTAFQGPIFGYTFQGSEPAGRYAWEVILARSGGSPDREADVLSRHTSAVAFRGRDGSAPVAPDPTYLGNPRVKRDWREGLGNLPADTFDVDPQVYWVRTRTIHGTTVVVAIHASLTIIEALDGFAVPAPDEFAEYVFACFERFWSIFQGFVFDRYTVKVTAPSDPQRFTGATAVGQILSATDNPTGIRNFPPHHYTRVMSEEFVPHEIFHAWNGQLIQPVPTRDGRIFQLETWIVEGATVYYAALVRGPLLGLPAYQAAMEMRRRTYARLVGTEFDLSVEALTRRYGSPSTVPPPPSEASDMLYARSALLAYLLDLGLFEQGVTLDALMRYLFDHYALPGRQWIQADLPPALEAVSGRRFEDFFDAYLHTNAPLPLDGGFLFVDRERHELR